MAYEWIKVEVITPDKPEIYQLAEILSIDPDSVLGKLIRLWSWADQQTIDGNANGNATSVTKNAIDRITFFPGFADALLQVGWLKVEGNTLMFPNFERHNGKSSKKRTLSNRRVTEHRKKPPNGNANSNAESVTSEFQKALPEEELEEEVKDKPPISSGGENLHGGIFQEIAPPNQLDGLDIPIGKFTLYDGWVPSTDFQKRAALWGRVIVGPPPGYTQQELAAFTSYWVAEGKIFNHVQWEQKFADSVLYERRQQSIRQPIGASHAEKSNAGESQTVRDIRAARAAWEQQQGVDAVGNHGGNIFESVDEQERADANGSLDGASRRSE
ncbi:DnaT-like ssDNA-binding domain-containing protein [Pectobacterium brasiliense]|uniref:DnaT-like ssDNA-binding domain-containing protein n=1 Tax=Pectobacterium brasiliense TaxID=180957 RepID=UPI0020C0CEFE|nr:DnaT-like ssDNA-binding domain-containing protein [Pectobacterium brasiliense]